jgi:trans-2,3-dihydro-3-hydroxyanthranilate isomerase
VEFEYVVVDVFTQTPLQGNPLAVFPDARGLDDSAMQRIARELNLSETSFILPPSDPRFAARVRIFTPAYEMLFAGHPTIGTSYVMRERGLVARDTVSFVLEEKIGPVAVRVERGERPAIWLLTPPIWKGPVYERERSAQIFGLSEDDLLPGVPPQVLSAGNPNLYVAVRDKGAVDRAIVNAAFVREIPVTKDGPVCAFVFAPTPEGAYSRMFSPELSVVEDPATGSATGPLAAFMMEHGLAPAHDGARFVSEQGTKMGRRSLLHVLVHGERGVDGIEVGGYVVPVARATMTLA